MKRFVTAISTAAVFAVFSSYSASATDLLTPSDAYSSPAISWGGIIAGGAVGYGAANYELSVPGASFDGISGRGLQGCGILGAQRQTGQLVLGAEGRTCFTDISTELDIGKNSASLDLDQSYSLYGKAGIAYGGVLTSVLAGYRWQHYDIQFNGSSAFEDTIGGISGGVMIEKKLDSSGNWNLGLETLFTQFEEQEANILNIDPTLFEGNLRLTYTFGN